MQAEFLNIFMEKQHFYLVDTLNRLVMAESKTIFAEKNLEAKQKELANFIENAKQLEENIESLNFDLNASKLEIEQAYKEKNSALDEINKLKFKFQEKENEAYALRSELNTIKTELASMKNLEKNMITDYRKLEEAYNNLQKEHEASKDSWVSAEVPIKKTKTSKQNT